MTPCMTNFDSGWLNVIYISTGGDCVASSRHIICNIQRYNTIDNIIFKATNSSTFGGGGKKIKVKTMSCCLCVDTTHNSPAMFKIIMYPYIYKLGRIDYYMSSYLCNADNIISNILFYECMFIRYETWEFRLMLWLLQKMNSSNTVL